MEQRIEKLERQCRWYRNLFILAGVIAVALVTWGAAAPIPKVIKARSFKAVHENGNTVAELGAWKLGGWLVINRAGTGKFYTDLLNEPAFMLTLTDDGSATFTMNNGKEKPMIDINSTINGAILDLFNKAGKSVVQIRTDADGDGEVWVGNAKGVGKSLNAWK